MTITEDELLTKREAQNLLQVTYITLYRWAKAGKITPRGQGKRLYYLRSELEALMYKPKD